MQHGRYIPCQDGRIQQGPNQLTGVSEAHDLSSHCEASHLGA